MNEWMKTNSIISEVRLPSDYFTANELFNHGQIIYLIYASFSSFVKVIINNSIGCCEN